MRVVIDEKKSVIRLVPRTQREDKFIRWLSTGHLPKTIVYGGRSGADVGEPYSKRMSLKFTSGSFGLFVLVASGDKDEEVIRTIRDSVYFGGDMIFLRTKKSRGKISAEFCTGICKCCKGTIVGRGRSEWKVCEECVAKCKHVYEKGQVHGGSILLGLGKSCVKCGRGKPADKIVVLVSSRKPKLVAV